MDRLVVQMVGHLEVRMGVQMVVLKEGHSEDRVVAQLEFLQ